MDPAMEPKRVWIVPRGTIPFPPTKTSIIVDEFTIIDDLRALTKKELAPMLDAVPKPAITFYAFHKTSDDYRPQNVTRKVLENPLPELLSEAPGINFENPLFFDWDPAFVAEKK